MPGSDADAKVRAWLNRDDSSLRFTLAMLDEIAAQKTLDYPTASVAVQRLSQLASRGYDAQRGAGADGRRRFPGRVILAA